MEKAATIAPCLWFDDDGEEAAEFYCSIFPNSRIVQVTRFTDAGREHHGKPAGSVMTVAFELDGQPFTALNGSPQFRFNEAISLAVHCDSQEGIDHYWERLSAGGDEQARQCGWLKDRYGVSWQVVPTALVEMLADPDPEKARRAMEAVLGMKKIDLDGVRRAHAGEDPA